MPGGHADTDVVVTWFALERDPTNRKHQLVGSALASELWATRTLDQTIRKLVNQPPTDQEVWTYVRLSDRDRWGIAGPTEHPTRYLTCASGDPELGRPTQMLVRFEEVEHTPGTDRILPLEETHWAH